MARIRQLTATEQRILGALMEKERTTPDQYPLTVNALLSACNQKTGRDPVTGLTETEVWDALDALRQDVLVWRSEGARVVRWRHCLDRRLELDAGGRAILALLLLRGPQTAGELRSRSGRLYTFASREQVEERLAGLAAGTEPLVAVLPRRPGQREERWRHLLGGDDEPAVGGDPETAALETAVTAAPTAAPVAPAAAAPPARVAPAPQIESALEERLDRLEDEVATLKEQLADLRRELGADS